MRVIILSLALLMMCGTNGTGGRAANGPRPQSTPAASPQDAAPWETYTYHGEEFSVALPEMPTVHPTTRLLRDTNRNYEEGRIIGAYGDGIVYLIHVYDRPRVNETVDYFASYYKTNDLGAAYQMFAVGELKLAGFKGKKYEIKLAKAETDAPIMPIYIYQAKKHTYLLEVYGAAESQPAARQFLTSFKLMNSPAGRKIEDDDAGPTPAPAAPALAPTPTAVAAASGTEPTAKPAFTIKEVVRRAVIVSKPEPSFTEIARMNNLTGEVLLRMVLGSNGHVQNIVPIKRLGDGLTEQAVRAARHIKFVPAQKDGRFVSQYVTVVYNFNIY